MSLEYASIDSMLWQLQYFTQIVTNRRRPESGSEFSGTMIQ